MRFSEIREFLSLVIGIPAAFYTKWKKKRDIDTPNSSPNTDINGVPLD